MTVADPAPDPPPDPSVEPPDALEAASPASPAGPSRPSLRVLGLWLLAVGLAVALDGMVGGLTMVLIAAVLLAGLPARWIGALGVTALALAPVAFLAAGVPSTSDVSPGLVVRSLLPHHLTFAGLVLVGAFAVIDLAPHLRAWASAEHPVQDDGPPIGVVGGVVVVALVAVGAAAACWAVIGA